MARRIVNRITIFENIDAIPKKEKTGKRNSFEED